MLSEKSRNFLVTKFNKMVKEIQTFYEGNAEEQKKEYLKDLMSAERIYFLGFGYHDENLKALGLSENEGNFNFNSLRIKGTAVNMTKEEVILIKRRLGKVFKPKDVYEAAYLDIQCSWDSLDKSEPCLITNFLRNVAPLS